jgi:hypothetical protein
MPIDEALAELEITEEYITTKPAVMVKPKHNNHLFISFTSLVYHLKNETIDPKYLEDGLFYFGCAKELLCNNHCRENIVMKVAFNLDSKNELKRAQEIYKTIKSAVFKADEDGRALFRQENEHNNYKQLNELLEKNDIDTSTVEEIESKSHYNYRTVVDNYNKIVNVIY